ncbi:MAG: hypothetical protein Q8R55_00210 [Candidatus Taylorbacteria bacterium]|nr:hypothetical protein [Candidatus Taylorbacteria bacterium]
MMARSKIGDDLKGRIAEFIVEQMFIRSRRRIHRYGFEWRLSVLAQIKRNERRDQDPILAKLGKTPDFVIEDLEGRLELLEVKYRQQGQFTTDDLPKLAVLAKTWSPTLVLVSYNPTPRFKVDRFRVVHAPYDQVSVTDRNPRDPQTIMQQNWGIDPHVYEECCELCELFGHFLKDESWFCRRGTSP